MAKAKKPVRAPKSAPRRKKAPSPKGEARAAYSRTLLLAAETVFSRSGFSETKMSDIAKQAGVAVGTLYNYFDSKEAIFEAIMDSRSGDMRALLEPLASLPPLPRVRGIIKVALAYLEEHSALFAIFVERGAMAEYDMGSIGGRAAEVEYERFLEMLTAVLEEAARDGDLRRDIPASHLAAALSGAMNGYVFAWLKRRRGDSLQDGTSEIFELFFSGARAR